MGIDMEQDQERDQPKSWNQLKVGDLDPGHGVVIKYVIQKSRRFIVYLDDHCDVYWNKSHTIDGDHVEFTLNKVALLETKSEFLRGTNDLFVCRKLLGESVARLLSSKDGNSAQELLNEAKIFIGKKNRELARLWFYGSAYTCAFLLLIGLLFSVFLKPQIEQATNPDVYLVALAMIIGGIGALMSVVTRSSKIVIDATEGKSAHQFEGVSRIVAGCIGGLFVSLVIKSGVLFGGQQFSEHIFHLVLTASVIAGASERLVPSLIDKIGGQLIEGTSS